MENNTENLFRNNQYPERGVLGSASNPEARIVNDIEQLECYVEALKTLGLKIVLTSGSFDLIHIGHAKYLEKAKQHGDFLIVGVDSDEKIKKRKGPDRPIVPEEERSQMLAYLRSADIIKIKQPDEPRWELIKTVRPDTLVVTKETYNDDDLEKLKEFCGEIVNLEPQATTSTSAKLRRIQIGWLNNILMPVDEILKENEVDVDVRRKIGKLLIGEKSDE